MPILVPGAGPGTGIQVIPSVGQQMLVAVVEGEEGFFYGLGFYWNPKMQTPATALGGLIQYESQDSTAHFGVEGTTVGPGDIIMRHPSGSIFRMGTDDFSMRDKSGGCIRFDKDGNVIIQSVANIFMQAGINPSRDVTLQGDGNANGVGPPIPPNGGNINTWSTSDTNMNSNGNFNVTVQGTLNETVQKDVLITSAEGQMTLQTVTDAMNLYAATNLTAIVGQTFEVRANEIQMYASNLMHLDGDTLQVSLTHQFYGIQSLTNDITMYAPLWAAYGINHATLSGSTVDIGTSDGSAPVRANKINLTSNKGLASTGGGTGATYNSININASGAGSQINAESFVTSIFGDTDLFLSGAEVVIGRTLDPTINAAQNLNQINDVILSAPTIRVHGGSPTNTNTGLVYVTSQDIYNLSTRNSVTVANETNWTVGKTLLSLMGKDIEIGVQAGGTSTPPQIPGPNDTIIAGVLLNELDIYGGTMFVGGSGIGAAQYMNTLDVKVTNQTFDALNPSGSGTIIHAAGTVDVEAEIPGTSLMQLLGQSAMDVFNNHYHLAAGVDTSAPVEAMTSAVLTTNLYADAGTQTTTPPPPGSGTGVPGG